jgi:hypothetical protein
VLNFGEWGNPNTDEYGNSGYGKPAANLRSVYNNYDINYMKAAMATLILANRVVDNPPDKAKEFFFTLYFKDDADLAFIGNLDYTGGLVSTSDIRGDQLPTGSLTGVTAPANGTLTFTEFTFDDSTKAGMATVTLLHGQLIEIEVPEGSFRIVQQTGWPYDTSFYDDDGSGFYQSRRDTGPAFREIEAEDVRRIDFFNGIDTTPPTGLNMGSPTAALPFTMIIGGLWLVARSINDIRRRRRTKWETS